MGGVVQLDGLAELLADTHPHESRLVEVAQVAESVIELRDGLQDKTCTNWTDRVSRDVYRVKHLVLLEKIGQHLSEIVVQLIAVEVHFRDVVVDTQ